MPPATWTVSFNVLPQYVSTSSLADANLWSAVIYPLFLELETISIYGTGFLGSETNERLPFLISPDGLSPIMPERSRESADVRPSLRHFTPTGGHCPYSSQEEPPSFIVSAEGRTLTLAGGFPSPSR